MYSSTPFPTKGYLTSMIKLSMAMALILPFLSPKICFSYTQKFLANGSQTTTTEKKYVWVKDDGVFNGIDKGRMLIGNGEPSVNDYHVTNTRTANETSVNRHMYYMTVFSGKVRVSILTFLLSFATPNTL